MKKHIKILSYFLFCLILIIGCVPSKPAYEEREVPIERIIKKIEANRRKVKTFEGNGVINIKTPKLEAKASFEIQIKKPDSVKFSVYGPFGIDLAHALVTKNSFKFYDVMKNTIYNGKNDQNILKKIFKIDISFNNLMDAFAGSVNLTEKLSEIPQKFKLADENYKLTYRESGNTTNFYMDISKLNIKKYELFKDEKFILSGKYSKFRDIDDLTIPYHLNLENDDLEQYLDIDYRNVKINPNIESLKLEFPSDVKFVNWNK